MVVFRKISTHFLVAPRHRRPLRQRQLRCLRRLQLQARGEARGAGGVERGARGARKQRQEDQIHQDLDFLEDSWRCLEWKPKVKWESKVECTILETLRRFLCSKW